MPFAELDALYHCIFISVLDLDSVLRILAWHILEENITWGIHDVDEIFSFNSGETLLLFCDLHSIIDIRGEDPDETLHFFHASLEDFLLDKSRSKDLHIDAPLQRAKFSCTLFQEFPRQYSIFSWIFLCIYIVHRNTL